MTCVQRRIAWLIGVFAVLAAAPLVARLVPVTMATLPLVWFSYSLPLGGFMILALWVGIGRSRLAWRVVGFATGCAYLAIWSTLADWSFLPDDSSFVTQYVQNLTPYVIVGILICALFAVLRRWFQISECAQGEPENTSHRFQFSVFHLLVLMSFSAIVLSLMRGARGSETSNMTSWRWWAGGALTVVVFFSNTACAAFAALGQTTVKRNCLLVLLASALLGTGVSISMRHDQLSAWHLAAGVTTMVLPAVGVLASLLWLRPCGVRLVPRQPNIAAASIDTNLTTHHA